MNWNIKKYSFIYIRCGQNKNKIINMINVLKPHELLHRDSNWFNKYSTNVYTRINMNTNTADPSHSNKTGTSTFYLWSFFDVILMDSMQSFRISPRVLNFLTSTRYISIIAIDSKWKQPSRFKFLYYIHIIASG